MTADQQGNVKQAIALYEDLLKLPPDSMRINRISSSYEL